MSSVQPGSVGDLADLRWELEERHHVVPGVAPDPHRRAVIAAPRLLERIQLMGGVLDRRRGVDALERGCDGLHVLRRHVTHQGADQVHDALLRRGPGELCCHGFWRV